MTREKLLEKIKKFPDWPGVYVMKNAKKEIIYIGKATSLRLRVLSYFNRPQDAKTESLLANVSDIDTQKTDSVIEALLAENKLIKQYQPKYNIKLKDDKTYIGILVTKEDFPRVIPARLTEKLSKGEFFGPFPSSWQAKEALKIIRKIFPYRTSCNLATKRPCLDYQIGLCPGVCAQKMSKDDYKIIVGHIKLFLKGEKKKIIKDLEVRMKLASKEQNFEQAAKLRDRIFALKHIADVNLIKEENDEQIETPKRIEAYDISNISGAFTVGSMVVFTDGVIDKNEYRKFKINSVKGANDIEAMREVLERRLAHKEWLLPDMILVDGGRGQVNMAKMVLKKVRLEIPVIGIAKGPDRKKNEFIKPKNLKIDEKSLIALRDEAHRFAITYYRLLHKKSLK